MTIVNEIGKNFTAILTEISKILPDFIDKSLKAP